MVSFDWFAHQDWCTRVLYPIVRRIEQSIGARGDTVVLGEAKDKVLNQFLTEGVATPSARLTKQRLLQELKRVVSRQRKTLDISRLSITQQTEHDLQFRAELEKSSDDD